MNNRKRNIPKPKYTIHCLIIEDEYLAVIWRGLTLVDPMVTCIFNQSTVWAHYEIKQQLSNNLLAIYITVCKHTIK